MASDWLSGRLPKQLLALSVIVAIVLLGIVVSSTTTLSRLKHQLVEKQQLIVSLTEQNDTLQVRLASLETERKELEGRLATLRTQLTAATGDLDKLRGTMTELQVRYDAIEDEKRYLQTQVDQLTKDRNDVKDRLSVVEKEKSELERVAVKFRERLALLDRDYQQLARKLSEVEQRQSAQASGMPFSQPPTSPVMVGPTPARSPVVSPGSPSTGLSEGAFGSDIPAPSALASSGLATPPVIELPPIVVRKQDAGMGPAIQARLIEVNPSSHFVVIDKGTDDGVLVGMTFDVLRDGATVGRVVAVRVRPQLAACDIIGSRPSTPPHVGDLVVQRHP